VIGRLRVRDFCALLAMTAPSINIVADGSQLMTRCQQHPRLDWPAVIVRKDLDVPAPETSAGPGRSPEDRRNALFLPQCRGSMPDASRRQVRDLFKIGLLGVVTGGLLAATSTVHGQNSKPVLAPSPLAWAGSLVVEPAWQFEKAARQLLISLPNSHVQPLLDASERSKPAAKAIPAKTARAAQRIRATFTRSNRTGHPSLPMGTMVRVTNPRTGHNVVVRIGDRCRRCQINLSIDAARAIGLTEQGVGPVEMVVLN
jgi:hypothetical protein